MKQLFLTVILGSILIVLFDTLASLISLHFQINYSLFSIGSIFIYAYIGFYCTKYGGLLWSAMGAAIIGLVDSTLGWYASRMLGVGRPQIEPSLAEMLITISVVSLMAILFGLVGGLFYRLLNRRAS